MAALDDFYKSHALGSSVGQKVAAAQNNRADAQFRNSLAPQLAEGDYAGAAQTSFDAGRVDTGMKLQEQARALAKADRDEAKAKGEVFEKGYGAAVDVLGRIDAARQSGLIKSDEEHMAALEQGLASIKPYVSQNEDLAKTLPNLLQTYFNAPPGTAAVYNEEYFKDQLEAASPKFKADEANRAAKLELEGRRTAASEKTAAAKAKEADVAERSLESSFKAYGDGETDSPIKIDTPDGEVFFDPIEAASGPASTVKAFVRGVPGVGGSTEYGKDNVRAKQRLGALGKDLLRIYSTNDSRVSNFDMEQTKKIFNGASAFKSAASLTDGIQEARRIAITNYDLISKDAQDGNLERTVRSAAQKNARQLQKVIRDMDEMLVMRKVATTEVAGKVIPELSNDEIRAAMQAGELTPEQVELIKAYKSYGR